MKKFATCVHILLLAFVCCLSNGVHDATAQDMGRAGTVGLCAILQEAQQGIALPIWVNDRFVFEPMINVVSVSDVGTDLGVGVLLRGIMREGDVLPYAGLRLVGLFYSPSIGDSSTDIVIGPTFGGEYLVGNAFSLRVEAQFNYAMSDENSLRFGNADGTTLNTATAVIATVYF